MPLICLRQTAFAEGLGDDYLASKVRRILAVTSAAVVRMTMATALLCALSQPSAGQARAPDSVRIARLSAVGRLWGLVKYFHPALAEGSGSWDANTAAAIDAIRASRSTADYSAAVSTLLATLHDPASRVVTPTVPVAAAATVASVSWNIAGTDSTLLIQLPSFDRQTTSLLRGAIPDLLRATRVVFDLRGLRLDANASGMFETSGIDTLLPATPVAVPPARRRMHSGFPTESGTTSGRYWSGTYDQPGPRIPAGPNTNLRRIIFLVTSESDLPDIAFALQGNGQGALVVDGDMPLIGAAVEVVTIPLGEQVSATICVGQLAGVTADTAVARDGSRDAPLDAALALAHRKVNVSRSALPGTSQRAAIELPNNPYPSTGYRVLAAYQWWNAIHYFYPYKALIGEDWDAVLPGSIVQMEAAQDSMAYVLGVAIMATHIHDSHGFVISPTMERHYGTAYIAAQLQYIGGEPVVVSIAPDSATLASGLAVGDVILRVDGEDAAAKRSRLARYIPHSTPQSLDALVARGILTGAPGAARLTVRDAHARIRELSVPRAAAMVDYLASPRYGPVLKLLPGNIGYADLSRLPVSMVDSMFALFRNTRAIIFDDRGYPQGTAWSIAPRLTDRQHVAAARFDRPLVLSPDSTRWATYSFIQYLPATSKPRYHGKTVMLVDERTISQAEHTGLFFEAANHTVFVGSPTMGANGDVTAVVLAGGVTVYFSGNGVRHADGRQLQRSGLQPNIVVRPTLKGIQAGRDEVLERALSSLRTTTPAKRP